MSSLSTSSPAAARKKCSNLADALNALVRLQVMHWLECFQVFSSHFVLLSRMGMARNTAYPRPNCPHPPCARRSALHQDRSGLGTGREWIVNTSGPPKRSITAARITCRTLIVILSLLRDRPTCLAHTGADIRATDPARMAKRQPRSSAVIISLV